jgi:hypothetical protein
MRQREADRLVERVLAAQDAIAYSNRRVAATVDYTRPQLFGPSVPQRVRSGLRRLIGESAAGQVAGIREEQQRTRELRLLPWHGHARRARAALVRYLDDRIAYLRAVAADPDLLYVEHPELERSLAAARAAFFHLADQERLDAAFAGGTHPG